MTCDRCGASPAFQHLEADLTLCLLCAGRYVLVLDARQDLLRRMIPVLGPWEEHWRGLGLSHQELRECLEALATYDLL